MVKPAATDPSEPATVAFGGFGGNEGYGSYLGATFAAQIINPKLYIIDPYLPPFNGSTSIDPQTVISNISSDSAYSAVQAKGMITDGSATAIAVYSVGVNKQVTFTGTDGLQFESWNPALLSG